MALKTLGCTFSHSFEMVSSLSLGPVCCCRLELYMRGVHVLAELKVAPQLYSLSVSLSLCCSRPFSNRLVGEMSIFFLPTGLKMNTEEEERMIAVGFLVFAWFLQMPDLTRWLWFLPPSI